MIFSRRTSSPTRCAASASSSTILIIRVSLSSLISPASPPLLRRNRSPCYRDRQRGGHALDQENPCRHRHLRAFPQRASLRLLFWPRLRSVADWLACGRYRVDRRLVFP